jgi:hypothetical protein
MPAPKADLRSSVLPFFLSSSLPDFLLLRVVMVLRLANVPITFESIDADLTTGRAVQCEHCHLHNRFARAIGTPQE